MIKFYCLQIKLGKMTLDEVPERWRSSVEAELNNSKKEDK